MSHRDYSVTRSSRAARVATVLGAILLVVLIGRFMVFVNRIFDLILHPIGWLVRKIYTWLTPLFVWLMQPVTNRRH